jgi:hypothetical protein
MSPRAPLLDCKLKESHPSRLVRVGILNHGFFGLEIVRFKIPTFGLAKDGAPGVCARGARIA